MTKQLLVVSDIVYVKLSPASLVKTLTVWPPDGILYASVYHKHTHTLLQTYSPLICVSSAERF